MKNIEELRNEALQIVQDLRSGKLRAPVAVEMNNAIGKACNTIKLELEYAALRKEKPQIAFMDKPGK